MVIVGFGRTPMGRFRARHLLYRAEDMSAHLINKLLERNVKVDLNEVEDVIWGCVNQDPGTGAEHRAHGLDDADPAHSGQSDRATCARFVDERAAHRDRDNGDVFVVGGVEHIGPRLA